MKNFFEKHVYLSIVLFFTIMVGIAWAADTKLSALTELAAAPAESDELYINDGGVSKKITILNTMNSLEAALTSYEIHADNLPANSPTATALAANGANCDAGKAPLGVDASGAAESCIDLPATYQPLDTDLTNYAVAGNAVTASALAANGGNCDAGSYPLGVDAAGAVESCTDATTEIEAASINNVVEDTTPQLGGDLDMNAKGIDFPTTANITDVKDEDNMASDSATMLATQQSIKKYVDDNVGGVVTGDVITTAPLQIDGTTNVNDILPGADVDRTFSILTSTTTAQGSVELSTDAESVTGASDAVVVTPGTLTARLAAPGAIGGTTPATDVATDSVTITPDSDPGWTGQDSDDAAGTWYLYGNSSGGANDIIMSLGVEDSSGESTEYMQLDGVTETVDMLKPTTLQAGDIVVAEMAVNSVDSDQYVDASIDEEHLGVNARGSLAPMEDDPDNFAGNFTGENLYGGTFIANAAGTAALPKAAVLMNFTYVVKGDNANVIDPDETGTDDTIMMNGLDAAQNENLESSTTGHICVFQYYKADFWMATCNGFVEATP